MTDLAKQVWTKGMNEVDRIKHKEENERRQKGLRCGRVLANQKRKHRGGRNKEFLFLVSLSDVSVIKVVILIPPRCTLVLLPALHASNNPRSAESCSRTSEIRQIFIRTTWLELARLQTCPSGFVDLFPSEPERRK